MMKSGRRQHVTLWVNCESRKEMRNLKDESGVVEDRF